VKLTRVCRVGEDKKDHARWANGQSKDRAATRGESGKVGAGLPKAQSGIHKTQLKFQKIQTIRAGHPGRESVFSGGRWGLKKRVRRNVSETRGALVGSGGGEVYFSRVCRACVHKRIRRPREQDATRTQGKSDRFQQRTVGGRKCHQEVEVRKLEERPETGRT